MTPRGTPTRFKFTANSDVLWVAFEAALGIALVVGAYRIRRELAAVQASEQRYRMAVECAPDGILITDTAGVISETNSAACRLLGRPRRESLGVALSELAVENRSGGLSDALPGILAGRTITQECLLRRRGEAAPVVEVTGGLLRDGRVMMIFRDITERKRAEQAVEASLAAKDVLLKEVHHRVKNNLQIISSLLSLQSRKIGNPELLDLFRESENRVKSIALLHEELYRSKDAAKIDFAAYLQNVVKYLSSAYQCPEDRIRLSVRTVPLTLGLDAAVPCALIVNELVSNAIKHGFPNGRRGEIYVVLESGGGKVTVTVGDTGVGITPDDDRSGGGIGLQLLAALVRQLGASMEHRGGQGTEFRVSFRHGGQRQS